MLTIFVPHKRRSPGMVKVGLPLQGTFSCVFGREMDTSLFVFVFSIKSDYADICWVSEVKKVYYLDQVQDIWVDDKNGVIVFKILFFFFIFLLDFHRLKAVLIFFSC